MQAVSKSDPKLVDSENVPHPYLKNTEIIQTFIHACNMTVLTESPHSLLYMVKPHDIKAAIFLHADFSLILTVIMTLKA